MSNWEFFKRVAWERSGGHYMFWTGALYFAVGMYCIFVDPVMPVWSAQVVWIAMLAFPFTYPPFGRWLNMDINWDKNMFNFFKKKTPNNVIRFPEVPKTEVKAPEPKAKEKDPHTFYRLGITDNRRVSLQMGYSEITMNWNGINDMIKQLEVFRDQIADNQDPEGEE